MAMCHPGCGHRPDIPSRALKKMLDDFCLVEDALTHATGGTGLGLSLVIKVITAMDGLGTAVRNNGPGCIITLRMPLT